MPRMDGTGPMGTGKIGRGLGPCGGGKESPRIGLRRFKRNCSGYGPGLGYGRRAALNNTSTEMRNALLKEEKEALQRRIDVIDNQLKG
ncbi:MAG TPA: DUF5320 domain-containing protein [Clostridia bacterium]|nr:DUF5320 domain-containing protein [Clostridia bacterium]